jgi:hypothetical protein
MGDEVTLWTIMIEALQRCDPPRAVRIEGAMETGMGNAPQPGNVARGHPLTAPLEGFQSAHAPTCQGVASAHTAMLVSQLSGGGS